MANPTLGLACTVRTPFRLPARPGVWSYASADRLRAELPLGFLQVVVSDALEVLHEAAVAGVPVGLWLRVDPGLPRQTEEELLPAVAGILTPWPSLARRLAARWPAYADRVATFRPALRRGPARRPTRRILGERPLELPPGLNVSAWTGRGEPRGAEALALVAVGRPVIAPARGILVDVVGCCGGRLVPDLLGSDCELDHLREAAAGAALEAAEGENAAAPAGPDLLEAAFQLARSLPHRVEDPPALPRSADPEGWIEIPRAIPRPHAALVLEHVARIQDFAPGEQADRYRVVPRRRPRPLAGVITFERPVVVACLMAAPGTDLREALASTRTAVDRAVVVYTGLPEPADEARLQEVGLPVEVLACPHWGGDFSGVRNLGLAHARGDHALILDHDERLVGPEAVRSLLRTRLPVALRLPVVNLGERGEAATQAHVRLLPLGRGVTFEGPLHETADCSGLRVVAVGRPYLVHHGYADPRALDLKYHRRNVPLAERHAGGQTPHRRLAGVRLRDALHADLGPAVLADRVLAFQRQVVEAEAWSEFLAWSPVFAEALERLGRGLLWSPHLPLPLPPGFPAPPQPQRLAFLHAADFERFTRWWLDRAAARARGLVDEGQPGSTPLR